MEVPFGYCKCGCGEKTPIAQHTHTKYGRIKGQPCDYLRGHARKTLPKRGTHNTELLCTSCKKTLPVSDFSMYKDNTYRQECKHCNTKRVREWNRNRCSQEKKNERLLRKYGITLDQYNTMLESQNNRCDICGTDLQNVTRVCVDHHHETSKVRGILCNHCNVLLGMAFDDKNTLTAAIKYLDKHSIT